LFPLVVAARVPAALQLAALALAPLQAAVAGSIASLVAVEVNKPFLARVRG
jgi:hypothetical protein